MLRRYEIYPIRYHQDDGETYWRACLFYKRAHGKYVFMKITKSRKHDTGVFIVNWKKYGLSIPSYVEPDRLQAVYPFEIGDNCIGRFDGEDIRNLQYALNYFQIDVDAMIERGEFCL